MTTTIPTDVEVATDDTVTDPIVTEEQNTDVDLNDDVNQPADDVPRLSDHDLMMQELGKKRNRQYGDSSETDDPDLGEVDDDDVNDDDDTMVTLKVDGEEVLKTQSEVDEAGGIVAMQKSLSGDAKLKAAAEQKKLNEKQARDTQQILADNETLKKENERLRNSAPAVTDDVELTEAEKAEAKDMTDKMFKGDAEALQSVMETMVKAKRAKPVNVPDAPPAPTTEEVAAQVEFNLSKKRAIKMFESGNPDLNTTAERRIFINDITKRVAMENDDWSPEQIMAESITRARVALNLPAPKSKEESLTERKKKKKKSADVIPQASQRRDTSKPKVKVKTKRELFEDIAAKRSHA